MPDLLENLMTYLSSPGVDLVREPSVAGNKPPLWLEPENGVPAPGQGDHHDEIHEDLVVGAFRATGLAPRPYEHMLRTDSVEFFIRSRTAPLATDFEVHLREALNDKRNFVMGTFTVIESRVFRDLQRLGSDELGYRWTTEYFFQLYQSEVLEEA